MHVWLLDRPDRDEYGYRWVWEGQLGQEEDDFGEDNSVALQITMLPRSIGGLYIVQALFIGMRPWIGRIAMPRLQMRGCWPCMWILCSFSVSSFKTLHVALDHVTNAFTVCIVLFF